MSSEKIENRICQNCKKEFTIELDDFGFYEKIRSPSPTWCPECRLIRRLSFRNERYLYKQTCELCEKEVLSVYNPDVKRKVFCPACWWSDNWNQLESGKDYDFSKPFFEQFKELQEIAPVQSLFLHYQTIVDSNYNNLAGYLKNCYMVFHADHNERCMYASGLKMSNDSQDVLMLQKNVNSFGDYIHHSKNTLQSYEMVGAENCRYCQFASTKTSKDCYDYTEYGENVEMVYETLLLGDGGANVRFCIQAVSDVRDVEYCYGIASSSNLFGCVGMRKKQYCILNKQYTKEEYAELVSKIRQHMKEMPYVDKHGREYKYGEFFPLELSSFAYNESTAQEFFPLDSNKAIEKGYAWKNIEEKSYQPTKSWKDLPNTIKETRDDITNEIILCESWDKDSRLASNHNCTKAFRILPQELLFYKKMNIPPPRKCPNSRHFDRIQFRNPIKLWLRQCACDKKHPHHAGNCEIEFETSYSPDRKEIVYCEKCYQQEVY